MPLQKSKTTFRIIAKTDIGKVREHNEDNYVVCPDLSKNEWFFADQKYELSEGCLMIIADGMGGLNAGEVASAITVDTIQHYFQHKQHKNISTQEDIKDAICEALELVQTNITEYVAKNPHTKGMGTTVVIGFIKDNVLHTAWIGDSRCYVFRDKKELYFATKDHSYVQQLVDQGKINYEQAFYHPESNIITKSIGEISGVAVKPDFASFAIQKGDRILLCSDGLNGMLMDDNIASILHDDTDINICAKRLIDKANQAGGHDNITLLLCDIVNIEPVQSGYTPKLFKLQHATTYKPMPITEKPFDTADPMMPRDTDNRGKKQKIILISSASLLLLLAIFLLSDNPVSQIIWDKPNPLPADTTKTKPPAKPKSHAKVELSKLRIDSEKSLNHIDSLIKAEQSADDKLNKDKIRAVRQEAVKKKDTGSRKPPNLPAQVSPAKKGKSINNNVTPIKEITDINDTI